MHKAPSQILRNADFFSLINSFMNMVLWLLFLRLRRPLSLYKLKKIISLANLLLSFSFFENSIDSTRIPPSFYSILTFTIFSFSTWLLGQYRSIESAGRTGVLCLFRSN